MATNQQINFHITIPNTDKLIELHNAVRLKYSSLFNPIDRLRPNKALMIYARQWADKMAEKEILKHSNISDLLNFGFAVVGENIIEGKTNEEDAIKCWLNNYDDKYNIINKNYTSIGCAFALSQNYTPYWCVCFGKEKFKNNG